MSAGHDLEGAGSLSQSGERGTGPPTDPRVENSRISLSGGAAIAAQLLLLATLMNVFEIISERFFEVFAIAAVGFVVHAWIPLRTRLPWFVLVSVASLFWVLKSERMESWTDGASWVSLVTANGAYWVLGIGLGLMGICHLPVSAKVRGLLLLSAAAGLALLRYDWGPDSTWSLPGNVWRVLGAMFMFRLIVYFYDLRTDKKVPRSFWHGTAYFFMCPNAVFPLFPVIDYKTFTKGHFDRDAASIYQKGVAWIFRGVMHLVLYRIIYLYLQFPGEQVTDWTKLVRYAVALYLMYLRVSGWFHLIVGMLCLYGFNLPETNHHYLLASGFNDYWRRINIYWKDFMMKVFYYPAFFKMRKIGMTRAMALATAFVFFVTWFLHSYQTYWIRGTFPLRSQDAVFWGILGVLVVGNTLLEAKKSKKKKGAKPTAVQVALQKIPRVLGMLTFLMILWSFWYATDAAAWWDVWTLDGRSVPGPSFFGEGKLWRYVVLFAGFGLLTCLPLGQVLPKKGAVPGVMPRGAPLGLLVLGLLTFGCSEVGLPRLSKLLPESVGTRARRTLESIRAHRLSQADLARQEEGYYDNLMQSDDIMSLTPEEEVEALPTGWFNNNARHIRHDFLGYELAKSAFTTFKNKPLHTNRWGMRDKEYDKEKPRNTYRAAVLGSSYVMGSGVGDDDTFENILEGRLNAENVRGGPYDLYEFLNFSIGGYGPLQQLMVMRKKVPDFKPNAVFYIAHVNDKNRVIEHIDKRRNEGIDPPFEFLVQAMERAGVENKTGSTRFKTLMGPMRMELLGWAYSAIANDCRDIGAMPVWVFLPRLNEQASAPAIRQLFELAKEAGFEILDLTGVYDGVDVDSIRIAEQDAHPNRQGHEMIAERLYEAIRANPRLATIARFE